MKRRKFLISSGTIFAASLLMDKTSAYQAFSRMKNNADPQDLMRRPNPDDFTQPILKAVAFGMNAPSPHNTQAWKFRIINDNEAMFYVDENRLLPATDPPARQIHMGCGCFLAVMKAGIASAGYNSKIEYFPEGNYELKDIGKIPVAKISLSKAEKVKSVLSDQIYSRQTNRLPYSGDLITTNEFKAILNFIESKHSKIQLLNDEKTLDDLLLLLYKGMEVECYDYDAYDETRIWFRVKDDIEKKRDGLNLRANGMSGVKLWFAEAMIEGYSPKSWHDETGILSYCKTHYDAVMSSKGIVIFQTATNNQMDWVKSGEDYANFQLAASSQNIYVHPLSQVLQEYPSMKKLYDEFNKKLQVNEPAKIQMAARIGRGDKPFYSYRRNVQDATNK